MPPCPLFRLRMPSLSSVAGGRYTHGCMCIGAPVFFAWLTLHPAAMMDCRGRLLCSCIITANRKPSSRQLSGCGFSWALKATGACSAASPLHCPSCSALGSLGTREDGISVVQVAWVEQLRSVVAAAAADDEALKHGHLLQVRPARLPNDQLVAPAQQAGRCVRVCLCTALQTA